MGGILKPQPILRLHRGGSFGSPQRRCSFGKQNFDSISTLSMCDTGWITKGPQIESNARQCKQGNLGCISQYFGICTKLQSIRKSLLGSGGGMAVVSSGTSTSSHSAQSESSLSVSIAGMAMLTMTIPKSKRAVLEKAIFLWDWCCY